MSNIDHLIAAWKERRALLAHQLEMLGLSDMHIGTYTPDGAVKQDNKRLRLWIAELDALIAEHSQASD